MCLLKCVGGAFTHRPEELNDRLSPKASDLVRMAFEDVDPARLVDYHTHVAGLGAGGTGNEVNPKMRTWRHPFHRAKFAVYLSAAGVEDVERADQEFAERLVRLVSNIEHRGKYRLLAFDKHYRRDGSVNLEKTEFYVPNEYVFRLAAEHPDLFEPVISVHPYRRDAASELERWARRGGRMVKWLPNAMGIDPSDEKCDPFYAKMKELGLVLLSHGGEEKAVEAEEDQRLGNPLRLRRALEHGVSQAAEEREPGRFPQVSGLRFTFDARRPAGSRVTEVMVGGQPLDERRNYTIALTHFVAAGGDGYEMFRGARYLIEEEGAQIDANIVMEAVKTAREIAPQTEGRIRRLDQ